MMKLRILGSLGLFAVFAGGAVYMRWLQNEVKSTREERNTALANIQALKEKNAAESIITKSLEERHAIIQTYKSDQDGLIAPVLRDTLDGIELRHKQSK